MLYGGDNGRNGESGNYLAISPNTDISAGKHAEGGGRAGQMEDMEMLMVLEIVEVLEVCRLTVGRMGLQVVEMVEDIGLMEGMEIITMLAGG